MPLENPSTWTALDRAAAILALVFASGYVVGPVETLIVSGLSGLLAPLSVWLPFSALVIGLGGVAGVTSSVARVYVRDTERVEQARDRMEDLRERLSEATESDGDPDDLAETQAELRRHTLTMLAENARPMVWSMAVSVPVFIWLRWVFTAPTVAFAPAVVVVPFVGPVAWTATLVGPIKLWLVWYLGASMSTGMLARRVAARFGLSA